MPEKEKDLYGEISRVAYELFERSGYMHGCDLEHWFEAERIVITRLPLEAEENPKKTKAPRKASTKAVTEAAAAKPKAKKPASTAKKPVKTKK
ncbi:MAG: hypothetical protein A4E65_03416 [Syntrophorhabdus sp. PtaU1.Bin153]|nr:MAG: hypothetical protein A4E65_03416 [Syntrophorhabdus sp. PtaU1.Bin153]